MAMSIIGYDEGDLYASSTANFQNLTNTTGLNIVILGLFHIHPDASIYYNETLLIDSTGNYQGDDNWPTMITNVLNNSSNNIVGFSAGFGGGGVGDYRNIKTIYEDNNSSFSGTQLETNFQLLAKVFQGAINTIDMDMESTYDQSSFTAFCQMVNGCGFAVTFCPYALPSFWVTALNTINGSNSYPVVYWNLQCYAGGAQNNPAQWASAISSGISGFDTNQFIIVSGTISQTAGQLQAAIAPYAGNDWLGGCFLWRFSSLLNQPQTLQSYIQAMIDGLAGQTT